MFGFLIGFGVFFLIIGVILCIVDDREIRGAGILLVIVSAAFLVATTVGHLVS